MGNEESSNGTTLQQLPAEMCLPIGGMRMNDEKCQTANQQEPLPIVRANSQRTHIVKTAFSGIWSLEDPVSESNPASRTGHFSCNSESQPNISFVGFGVGSDGTYFDDIWMLDASQRIWTMLQTNGDAISPRAGSRATLIDDVLYIFGGNYESTFFNDLYAVNLTTGQVQTVQTTGAQPTPRTSPIMSSKENEIFIWGGYDGTCPSELYVLDITSLEWKSYPQDISGRTHVAFTTVDQFIYAYGSSKTGGLLSIDMDKKIVNLLPTKGPEPQAMITDAAMVHFDKYLMFIGGKASTTSTLMYSLDLEKMRWFVFHILPDGSTVSAVDGTISDLGLFMLPRISSLGVIYINSTREIVGYLGHPMKDPSPLFILNIGEALSTLHLRSDMLNTIESEL